MSAPLGSIEFRHDPPEPMRPERGTGGRPEMGVMARALGGALLGGVMALLLMGVGLVRAAFFVVGGGQVRLPAGDDASAIILYVAAFMAAGAVIGAGRLERGKPVRACAVSVLSGLVLMLGLFVAAHGSPAALSGFDACMIALLGSALGGAFAFKWLRAEE